jgi:hypothetical protein
VVAAAEKWPPVYDPEDLTNAIRDLAGREDLEKKFFAPVSEETGRLCQGDILALAARVPVLDEDAQAVADDEFDFWLVIGNTCDFERDLSDVEWTQVVPVRELIDVREDERADLRAYQSTRRFYVPPWNGMEPQRVFAADLLRPAALHKKTIGTAATVVARLSFRAWFLLNGCLMRFFLRADGRLTP